MPFSSFTESITLIAKSLFVRKDEMIVMLSNPEFYIEWLLIGVALSLAWLVALLVRVRVKNHLHNYPPRKIDAEFISKPLALLGPVLALVYLAIINPFAVQYGMGGEFVGAIIQLCLAFMSAKAILMVIHSRPVAWFIASVVMIVAILDVTGFTKSTTAYLGSTAFSLGQFKISMLNLVHGVVILVVVFWIAGVLSHTLESYLRRSSTLSYSARELSVKFFKVLVYFIAFIITLSAMGVDLTAFAVFGGALGVGIGLGLQKITANFVSGITLLMEKSIQIGDLIEVANNTGLVRQLNIRYALIETADGREILIPNEELISTRVTNWTHTSTKARVEIKVSVSFESDPTKARELMLQAATEHKRCLKDPAPTCWLREFGEYGVNFLLTFWIPDVHDGRNGPQSEVMFAIFEKFGAAGIEIAVKKG